MWLEVKKFRHKEFLARLTWTLLKSKSEIYFVRKNSGTLSLGTWKTPRCPIAQVRPRPHVSGNLWKRNFFLRIRLASTRIQRRKRDTLQLQLELSDFPVKLFALDFATEVLFYFAYLGNLLTVELPRMSLGSWLSLFTSGNWVSSTWSRSISFEPGGT